MLLSWEDGIGKYQCSCSAWYSRGPFLQMSAQHVNPQHMQVHKVTSSQVQTPYFHLLHIIKVLSVSPVPLYGSVTVGISDTLPRFISSAV